MCQVAAQDIRSVTGRNCANLEEDFFLNPWLVSASIFSREFSEYDLSEQDMWRLPYLMDLLKQKYDMEVCGELTL